MLLSKKDKSLILFIVSAIIALWFVFSVISFIFSISIPRNSKFFDPLFADKNKQWFNVSKNLTKKDLEGRVVLLDFWSYDCINCLQNIEKIKKLEENFGDDLLVISVHSGRLDNEKNPQSVKEAIIKYGVNHPVINDYDLKIWKKFEISTWPTLVLVNPKGRIETQFEGQVNFKKLSKKIAKTISRYRFILNFKPLPLVLEKNKVASNILNFPSKIEYASNFLYNGEKVSALIISNSFDNTVIVSTLEGRIIEKIGSKKSGLRNGDFKDVSFNYPTGLLYSNNILYVADRGNNVIRKVDFTTRKVTTLVGSGLMGDILENEVNAKEVDLSSPQDLEYFPDKNHLIIANLGSNQLLSYNIKTNKIKPVAGNGVRGLVDGKYPKNSLAQPRGLDVYKNKLYFVDSYSSSLRSFDKSGNVKTLIGKSNCASGNKNGPRSQALMQSPSGLFANTDAIYVADSYNHLIRKYGYNSKEMSTYSGNGVKGNNVGTATSYSEVSDIILVKNNFYIVDSNNNRIVVKSANDGKTTILDILPLLSLPQDGFLEYLPNLEVIPNKIVKSEEEIDLLLDVSKGWKINTSAPSFFNIVEIIGKRKANLIASYDWNIIRYGVIKLPKMSQDNNYYLQGVIYYCEDKPNALCYIKSYESKIVPKSSSDVIQIKINL